MKNNKEKIPQEVLEHFSVSAVPIRIGAKLYQRLLMIEEKYPQWFPWETKYKSIPQQVHIAYQKEAGLYRDPNQKIECKSNGLTEIVKNITLKALTLEDLNFHKRIEDKRKEEDRLNKESKKIWDKHYSKFELEFRE
jgi:hypothetical protein